MKIIESLKHKNDHSRDYPPVTIAFLGDSVTQGCFEVYKTGPSSLETVFEQNNAYHARLKEILSLLYPGAPINIINAGISGDSSQAAFERIERDVLKFSPDLTVVCLGLNDCHGGIEGIEKYKNNLRRIFKTLKENDSEVIFMTPNMMNINVSPHVTEGMFIELGERFSKMQLDGILDKYMEAAREVCKKENIKICDCYKIWKSFYKGGVNITEILSNKLNHPIREMHWLFAHELMKVMFEV